MKMRWRGDSGRLGQLKAVLYGFVYLIILLMLRWRVA